MAVNKSKESKKASKREVVYSPATIAVTKVKEIANRENCYRFNLSINGVDIYGCQYVTYTGKDGKESDFISFPQYKGTDGNYYNVCYFPINAPEYRKEYEFIEAEIEKAVNA